MIIISNTFKENESINSYDIENQRFSQTNIHSKCAMKKFQIIHPRPSSIVAALYTLRDLNIEVAILHGPAGCSFKHARLLEEDGMKVLTTALDDNGFVFGGHDALVSLLKKAKDMFNPKNIGVVGTCVSMIIGESLSEPLQDADLDIPIITVEVHAGFQNNTKGVLLTLESALNEGLISKEEYKRQEFLLHEATNVEKSHGAASKEFIKASRGDLKITVSNHIINLLKNGKKCITIMNAKKETGYAFADITIAINEAAKSIGNTSIINMANIDDSLGLPRVRTHATQITNGFEMKGIEIHEIIGGLDEYAITSNKVNGIIKEKYSDYDFVVITGVPHAIQMDAIKDMEVISVTNGPRQVLPLKEMGHKFVAVEIDLHPKTLGVNQIIESEIGGTLRSLLNI